MTLIDAEELDKALYLNRFCCGFEYYNIYNEMKAIIRHIPTIDPVRHGHWVVLQDCANSGVYCSECQTKIFDRYPMKKKLSQYCGHCGAKMGGVIHV